MLRKEPDFRFTNYHTHTPRCLHASGTEDEYIRSAIAAGYKCLGFSDHTAWPYKSDFVAYMRMPIRELQGYFDTVRAKKEEYADRIELHLGLECEGFPEFYPWLEKLLADGEIEYAILGNHFDTNDENLGQYFGNCVMPEQLLRYMETTTAAMKTGMFKYLAHPDLFLNTYPNMDPTAEHVARTICETAVQLNMPLEYNLLGRTRRLKDNGRHGLGYSTDAFWKIASEYPVHAIIGVDAHTPEALDCLDVYRKVRRFMGNLGIKVIETIEL